MTDASPLLLVTMGDVAGIGPEIIARGWAELFTLCRPVVVGDVGWMQRALTLVGSPVRSEAIHALEQAAPSADCIPCLQATRADLSVVRPGEVTAAGGQAAYDFLCRAIDCTLAGKADGIITCPLHKEGLRAAGLHYPGHTEILAERCQVPSHAMLLYGDGIGVAHVTLHMALRDVFAHLTTQAVLDKIRLLDTMLGRILPPHPNPLPQQGEREKNRRPRIGVAALNPHASDGGLFGNEEQRIIRPAVEAAEREGIAVSGPWPADALFPRARGGEFDGVVAMYHDQGHIALKLLSGRRAVNITAGLPIVRTSVAHGTAYDIAGKGVADAGSLIEAARVAVRLCSSVPFSRGS